jgi:hypothetical protein
MTNGLGIDHPLVLVHDIEVVAARYRALGFHTAPTGFHPWGTSTSLILFERSALEIMSIYDRSLLDLHAIGEFRFGRHMADALAEREGVSLVALYSEDAPADRARLQASGIAAQGRVDFRRRVKLPDRDWDEAVVTLEILVDPAVPRASNFLAQQHKPHLVWVPEWMNHPNGAVGFAGITYAAPDPQILLKRMRRLFGADAVKKTPAGYAVITGKGSINIVPPGIWASQVGVSHEPDIGDAVAACIGIDVLTPDLPLVAQILRDADVRFVYTADGITVADFESYGNVLIRFVSPS